MAGRYAQSGTLPRQRFTGQEHDDETGLEYFNARSLLARTGRFNRPDPLFAGAMGNPQGWNRYAYVGNNPMAFTDPTGEKISIWNLVWAGINWLIKHSGGTVDGNGSGAGEEMEPPPQWSQFGDPFRSDSTTGGQPDLGGVFVDPPPPPTTTITTTSPETGSGEDESGNEGDQQSKDPECGPDGYRDAQERESSSVLEAAKTFEGVRYLKGAGPRSNRRDGADCSGLLMLAMKAAGFPYNYSPTFSLSTNPAVRTLRKSESARAGDVMLFPGHVGLYDPEAADGKILYGATVKKGVTNAPTKSFGTWTHFRIRIKC